MATKQVARYLTGGTAVTKSRGRTPDDRDRLATPDSGALRLSPEAARPLVTRRLGHIH